MFINKIISIYTVDFKPHICMAAVLDPVTVAVLAFVSGMVHLLVSAGGFLLINTQFVLREYFLLL